MLSDRILSPGGVALLAIVALVGVVMLVVVTRLAKPAAIDDGDEIVRRIFRNSSLPILSQFFVRGVDLLVALAVLRLLGPSGNGEYAIAVIIWFYVKTVSDFGLGLYATREISRSPELAGRITGGTALFRLVALSIAVVPIAAYVGFRAASGNMSSAVIMTICILLVSIVPGSVSEAINSALNGVERMDIAAGINVAVNLVRAPLAIVLAATSLGIVGIAIAALIGALISSIGFLISYGRVSLSSLEFRLSRRQLRRYTVESAPLLVNALLLSLFFRFDIFIVDAFRGSQEVGLYDAAFKPINLLTIIPAYATLAVFPLMARRATDTTSLARASQMTTYILVSISWAIVFATLALAKPAIQILAGDAYLPTAASLLRILIFFAPLSFLNGVYQYVLIAQGRQRDIVPVFVAAVLFNILGNLLFVPAFGAQAAATLTVLTEIVIFVAFAYVSRHAAVVIFDRKTMLRLVRPTAAGLLSVAAVVVFIDRPFMSIVVGSLTFIASVKLFQVIGPEERSIGRRLFGRMQA